MRRSTVFRVATTVIALVTAARALVLFLEALAHVRDERTRDASLLELCRSGVARESPRMRSACLAAQADRASPLLLKAVLFAFSAAYDDFAASLTSPAKVLLLILFAVTSVFLPITSVLRALVPPDEIDPNSHVVVLRDHSQIVSPRQRLRRQLSKLRFRKSRAEEPRFEEVDKGEDEEDEGGMITLELGHPKRE